MNFVFNSRGNYLEFQRCLKDNTKDESVEQKEKHEKIISTGMPIICLSMGFLRQVAKSILKQDPSGFLKFSSPATYEETMIHGLVAAGLKGELRRAALEKYFEFVDCWSLIDSVCVSIKLAAAERETYFSWLENLCYDEREFVSRFGIVSLMREYLDAEHIDAVLEILAEVKNPAYYSQMAVAWATSEAFIKHRDKTLELLKRQVLSKFAQNKAISKIRESFKVSKDNKQLLLKLKIN